MVVGARTKKRKVNPLAFCIVKLRAPLREYYQVYNDERVYKEYVSQTFNRLALNYDHLGPRFFSHFGNRLVELAGVYNGASVLDVGCGRGAIPLPAAERVGVSGEVKGCR
jgi:2-polyprenyl-3-methyl-5-hydroxy-6-metoxy-1,4-benzoquinol methylase